MMYIIKGYKVKSTDLQQVENVLAEIQKKAIMRSKHFYAELLANEIEALVEIPLNLLCYLYSIATERRIHPNKSLTYIFRKNNQSPSM